MLRAGEWSSIPDRTINTYRTARDQQREADLLSLRHAEITNAKKINLPPLPLHHFKVHCSDNIFKNHLGYWMP
jgi:hypothetical protein